MYSFSCVQSQALHTYCHNGMDASEDLVIHYLQPHQPCAAGLNWLEMLCDVVLYCSYETSEVLTNIYYIETDHV